MSKCTVTGIKVDGGINQLIPEYQKEIIKLRTQNMNNTLQDLDGIYSLVVAQYGDQGTKKILSLIDELQNAIEDIRG